jgi:arsenical pump membrane protein
VLSLFVTVYALRVYGVTGKLGEVLLALSGGSVPLLGVLYGAGSALAANVLNNIPMTLAFASATGGLSGAPLLAAALGTAIGSNLGANLTPIGALAGIMWMTILAGKEVRITFPEFVKYGLLVTPASLLACLAVLALQLMVGM